MPKQSSSLHRQKMPFKGMEDSLTQKKSYGYSKPKSGRFISSNARKPAP